MPHAWPPELNQAERKQARHFAEQRAKEITSRRGGLGLAFAAGAVAIVGFWAPVVDFLGLTVTLLAIAAVAVGTAVAVHLNPGPKRPAIEDPLLLIGTAIEAGSSDATHHLTLRVLEVKSLREDGSFGPPPEEFEGEIFLESMESLEDRVKGGEQVALLTAPPGARVVGPLEDAFADA